MLDMAFVADEVIIHDKNHAAPTKLPERIQLRQHLFITLGARDAAIDFDDVAELALKGTAARELHRHRAIAFEVDEMEVRNRCGGERWPFSRLIDTLGLAALKVAHELRQGRLGLAEEEMIGLG